jgi:hypothetical protein
VSAKQLDELGTYSAERCERGMNTQRSSALSHPSWGGGPERRGPNRLTLGRCPRCEFSRALQVVIRAETVLYVRCEECGALLPIPKPPRV